MSMMGRLIVIAIVSEFEEILQIIFKLDKCKIKSVMKIKSDKILRNL